MDPSGVQLDEEQHVQPLQPHGVDSEEVAGEDPGGLLAQERLPGRRGPARGRVQSLTAGGAAGRGCRDPHPGAPQFSLDALVAPAGVLLGEADDELLDLRVEGWTPRSTPRIGPHPFDQLPVPAQQRLGPDEEGRPVGPGKDAADGGEQRPVGGLELGSWSLAAEDGELVA